MKEWSLRLLKASLSPHDLRLDLARQWLQECIRNHHDCRSTHQKVMPTRLIKISKPANPRYLETTIRLVELDPSANVNYAALSYCWGMSQKTVLTSDSISDMRDNIQLDTLSQTIKETVLLCLKLEIQYLWVDALCILQDSATDWHSEAANMSTVYGNAFVTIKAAASDNSNGGLFRSQPQHLPELAPVMVRCLAPKFDNIKHAAIHLQNVSTEREPLETRAWTYQEDLLSPRTLTYGSREMWWECHSAMRSDGGRQIIESHSVSGLPKPLRTTRPAQFPNVQPDETATTRANWIYILTEYGVRHITYPADRLPALSGIAKVFQASLPRDRYLAGLWESHLPRSLLWHVSAPAVSTGFSRRAPSWSWGSIGELQPEAYITFADESRFSNVCCEYVSSKIEYRGANLYGRIKQGTLTLRAPLLAAWRVYWPTEASGPRHKLYVKPADYDKDQKQVKEDAARSSHKQDSRETFVQYEYNRLGKFNADAVLPEDQDTFLETWLLFILSSSLTPGDISRSSYGLVLEKVPSSSMEGSPSDVLGEVAVTTFRRIGTFSDAYFNLPPYHTVTIE